MSYKTFIVTHARARSPIIVRGTTLDQALRKEGLDPRIWKETNPPADLKGDDTGDNQGATRPEDY